MTSEEFLNGFSVYFNNITSNQAPGLNVYEICMFLTKAEYEITTNYFSANSKGNTLQQGFDDSAKRQADFSSLMKTALGKAILLDPYYVCISGRESENIPATDISFFQNGMEVYAPDLAEVTNVYYDPNVASEGEEGPAFITIGAGKSQQIYTVKDWPFDDEGTIQYVNSGEESNNIYKIDDRSKVFSFPNDLFIVINETYKLPKGRKTALQVIPLRYDEYTRLMSKPFKRPLKNQAWRLINNGNKDSKVVEIIAGPGTDNIYGIYTVRYIRKPKPIIVGSLDGLTIDGYVFEGDKEQYTDFPIDVEEINGCELDSSLHEAILQRAVELAKIAWTATGNDNAQLVMTAGTRSE